MGKKKEKPINLNELEEEEKMKYEIGRTGTVRPGTCTGLEITYFQRDREDRRTGDKKKTDAGERDSTDGGKNIEKPEAERSYFDKTTHF